MPTLNIGALPGRLGNIERRLEALESSVGRILTRLGLPTVEKEEATPKQQPPATALIVDAPQQPTEPTPYKYYPLDDSKDEIRILQLHGSKKTTDPLICSLLHRPLDGSQIVNPSVDANVSRVRPGSQLALQFTALSYTWGQLSQKSQIIIDGHTFSITRNLESALRHLRSFQQKKTSSPRVLIPFYLWIDAICINQDDLLERNSQVALMARIYKKATWGTLVWLGEEADDSSTAMNLIERMGKVHFRGPGEKEEVYQHATDQEKQLHWKALMALYRRPWFSRAWVRQEVAVPTFASFHCGDSVCQFETVVRMAAFLSQLSDQLGLPFNHSPSSYPSLDEAREITASFPLPRASMLADLRDAHRQGFLRLEDILHQTRACQATDARDKVFSVLGLVDPKIYTVKADYRSPVSEVFKVATVSIITKTKRLDILSAAQNPGRNNHIPSWVPNLTEDWKATPFKADQRLHSVGQREADFTFDQEKSVLRAKGSCLDIIETISPDFVLLSDSAEQVHAVWQCWRQFAATALNNSKISYSDKRRTEELLNRLTEQKWHEFLSLGSPSDSRFQYTSLGELVPGRSISIAGFDNMELAKCLLWTDEMEAAMNPYRAIHNNLRRYGVGRRLALSARGILALIPADAKLGHCISLLHGSSFPYVLQKQGEHYVVVGEACKLSYFVLYVLCAYTDLASRSALLRQRRRLLWRRNLLSDLTWRDIIRKATVSKRRNLVLACSAI